VDHREDLRAGRLDAMRFDACSPLPLLPRGSSRSTLFTSFYSVNRLSCILRLYSSTVASVLQLPFAALRFAVQWLQLLPLSTLPPLSGPTALPTRHTSAALTPPANNNVTRTANGYLDGHAYAVEFPLAERARCLLLILIHHSRYRIQLHGGQEEVADDVLVFGWWEVGTG